MPQSTQFVCTNSSIVSTKSLCLCQSSLVRWLFVLGSHKFTDLRYMFEVDYVDVRMLLLFIRDVTAVLSGCYCCSFWMLLLFIRDVYTVHLGCYCCSFGMFILFI